MPSSIMRSSAPLRSIIACEFNAVDVRDRDLAAVRECGHRDARRAGRRDDDRRIIEALDRPNDDPNLAGSAIAIKDLNLAALVEVGVTSSKVIMKIGSGPFFRAERQLRYDPCRMSFILRFRQRIEVPVNK